MTVSLNKLAKAVDEYDAVREARLAKDRESAILKKREGELKQFLIDNISKSDAMGVCGKTRRATIETKTKATPENWADIHTYIKKFNAFDLLKRELIQTAVRERWDDGKEIKGVGKIQVVDISLTKL